MCFFGLGVAKGKHEPKSPILIQSLSPSSKHVWGFFFLNFFLFFLPFEIEAERENVRKALSKKVREEKGLGRLVLETWLRLDWNLSDCFSGWCPSRRRRSDGCSRCRWRTWSGSTRSCLCLGSAPCTSSEWTPAPPLGHPVGLETHKIRR